MALVLMALGLNLWILWGQVKEEPQWVTLRHRVSQWWRKAVTIPQEQAAKLRKMEAETVFEAIQVVDNAGS